MTRNYKPRRINRLAPVLEQRGSNFNWDLGKLVFDKRDKFGNKIGDTFQSPAGSLNTGVIRNGDRAE